jgi:hypothetical protein
MARDRTLATLFIRRADPTRYSTLLSELSNNYAMGQDENPTNLTAAYSLLVNYKTPTNARTKEAPPPSPAAIQQTVQQTSPEAMAMTFAQKAAMKPGNNGIVHGGVTCYNCQSSSHYAQDCPKGTNTGSTLVQHAFSLAHTCWRTTVLVQVQRVLERLVNKTKHRIRYRRMKHRTRETDLLKL